MKLFVIYIGGRTETSLIELHDMRFVVAERIEDTYDELRRQWWGVPKSLHLDCWGELSYADGHRIHLKPTLVDEPNKLYFVNLGGYDPKDFTELHKNIFVVAEDESSAKTRALSKLKNEYPSWESPHRDYLFDVENCICLNEVVNPPSLYIHLEKDEREAPFEFTCKYVAIGKSTQEAVKDKDLV